MIPSQRLCAVDRAEIARSGRSTRAVDLRDQLRLPHGAKLKLIEDWERITREKKLAPLPRDPSIATLLDDWVAAKARRTSHERIYGEVCEGVRTYFNQVCARARANVRRARCRYIPMGQATARRLLRKLLKRMGLEMPQWMLVSAEGASAPAAGKPPRPLDAVDEEAAHT